MHQDVADPLGVRLQRAADADALAVDGDPALAIEPRCQAAVQLAAAVRMLAGDLQLAAGGLFLQPTAGYTDPVPSPLLPFTPIDESEAVRTRDFVLDKTNDACGSIWRMHPAAPLSTAS